MDIGNNLRELRRRRGLSQQNLAKLSGIGQDSISALETGKHQPYPATLRKLAAALGIEVEALFEDPNAPKGMGSARSRIAAELRSLPFEARTHVLEALTTREEPFHQERIESLADLLEGIEKPRNVAMGEFLDFLLSATTEEASRVLFDGARTTSEKKRAGLAYMDLVAVLVRQGRLEGAQAADRLAVAGELQRAAA